VLTIPFRKKHMLRITHKLRCFLWRQNNPGVHRVLVGKPQRKRPLRTARRKWEDNIKMDLQEVGGGGCGDGMELAQDRDRWRSLVGTMRNFWVP
jgi:hypothetical protein